jgi:hypothetical protein
MTPGFLVTARAISRIRVLQATEPADYANPGLAWMADKVGGEFHLRFVFYGEAAVDVVRPDMIVRAEDPIIIYDGPRDQLTTIARLKLDWTGQNFVLTERGEHEVADVDPVPWVPATPPPVTVGDPDNDNNTRQISPSE